MVSYVFLIIAKVTHSYFDMYIGLILLGTGMGLIFILTFFLQGVILNMAHHHGNIHSGFCWKKIIKRMRVIGFKNMILPYIITWIVLGSFYLFFVEQIKYIPIVGIYLSQMIITPYLIIFTMRVLGLVDRKFG
jgi:hypothetical protein